jgi:hypothetical protein
MPRRKTAIELRRAVAAREETLRKLHQRLMALDEAIMQAEDDAYALLCFEIGQLAASCGLTAIPLADLEVLFEALAAQWEAQQHSDTEAEP